MLTFAQFNMSSSNQTIKSRSQALIVSLSGLVFIVLVMIAQFWPKTRSVLGVAFGCVVGGILMAVGYVWDGYLQVADVVGKVVDDVVNAAQDTGAVVGNAANSVGQFLGGQSSDAQCQPGFAKVGALCYKQLNCPKGYIQDGRVCKMQTGNEVKWQGADWTDSNPPAKRKCEEIYGKACDSPLFNFWLPHERCPNGWWDDTQFGCYNPGDLGVVPTQCDRGKWFSALRCYPVNGFPDPAETFGMKSQDRYGLIDAYSANPDFSKKQFYYVGDYAQWNDNRKFKYDANHQQIQLASDQSKCMTAGVDNWISVGTAKCDNDNKKQKWTYDPNTTQIKNVGMNAWLNSNNAGGSLYMDYPDTPNVPQRQWRFENASVNHS